jgi:hypothetical protein
VRYFAVDSERQKVLRWLDYTGIALQLMALVVALVGLIGGAKEAQHSYVGTIHKASYDIVGTINPHTAAGVVLMVGSVLIAIIVAMVGYAVRLICRYLTLETEHAANANRASHG